MENIKEFFKKRNSESLVKGLVINCICLNIHKGIFETVLQSHKTLKQINNPVIQLKIEKNNKPKHS